MELFLIGHFELQFIRYEELQCTSLPPHTLKTAEFKRSNLQKKIYFYKKRRLFVLYNRIKCSLYCNLFIYKYKLKIVQIKKKTLLLAAHDQLMLCVHSHKSLRDINWTAETKIVKNLRMKSLSREPLTVRTFSRNVFYGWSIYYTKCVTSIQTA